MHQSSNFCFGPIKLRKLAILQEVEKLDTTKESSRLTFKEQSQESELRLVPNPLLQQQEIYRKQRMKEGDVKYKVLPHSSYDRSNQNHIPRIR